MSGLSPARIPDTFTSVWAFSDAHGMRNALLDSLVRAGLATPDGHWAAPGGTALVGLGDYIDRGRDVIGLVQLLRTLAVEAPARGGAVLLARGNHEQMALDALVGNARWGTSWLSNGGDATLRSLGVTVDGRTLSPFALEAAILTKAPWLGRWLAALPECVRWRDVLFVHAGPAQSRRIEDYGRELAGDRPNDRLEHLWVRSEFYAGAGIAGNPAYAALREAGISRVVFGHTPMNGPTLFHRDRSLCLDTNACVNGPYPAYLTLARIPGSGTLAATEFVRVETSHDPDRMGA